MSDYVPTEVLIDILKRLPIGSLLRFRCVCKAWYSLITNPTFISTHLNQKISNNDTHLLIRHCPDTDSTHLYRNISNMSNVDDGMLEKYSLHSDNDTFDVCANFTLPFIRSRSDFRIFGISNGLVCLVGDQFGHGHNMLLWNPSICKYVNVPPPDGTVFSHETYGFGFTPSTNDYKIVYLQFFDGLENPLDCVENPLLQFPDGVKSPLSPLVELYELSTGAWRSVHVGNFSYVVRECNPQAFLNGAAHWIGIKPGCNYTSNDYRRIVVFHMVSEELRLMRLPNGVGTLGSRELLGSRVAVFRDALSLVHCVSSQDGTVDYCCVWVMKEYGVEESWTKHFTIDLKQGFFRTPFGFRRNGDALLGTIRDKELVSYDPSTRQTRTLGIRGRGESFYVDSYVESLALLDCKENVGDPDDCLGTFMGTFSLSEEEDESEENTEVRRYYTSSWLRCYDC